MKRKNPHAVKLAELSKGKTKNFTTEERERRSQRMKDLNEKRYAGNSHQRRIAKRAARRSSRQGKKNK